MIMVMIMMIRRYETKNRMLVITAKIIIIMKSNNWEKREKEQKEEKRQTWRERWHCSGSGGDLLRRMLIRAGLCGRPGHLGVGVRPRNDCRLAGAASAPTARSSFAGIWGSVRMGLGCFDFRGGLVVFCFVLFNLVLFGFV